MANNLVPPDLQTQQPPVNALIPPVPTPPVLGFQLWASDPRNAAKIQPSMTNPDMPLQPNAGKMASVNPPAMASAAPPSLPQPVAPMVRSGAQAQNDADTQRLRDLQQSGAGLNQIQNPFLRGLAHAGDIASMFLLGRGSAAIPGTTAHNLFLQNQAAGNIQRDQAAIQAQQQQQLNQANLAHTQAETAAIPENQAIKRLGLQTQAGTHGLKMVTDEQGNVSLVPDEESPVYQQQQAKEGLIQAQTESFQANVGLRQAEAELAKAKADPNSPAFQLAQQRLLVAQQNASAAGERAQAYMGRYLQGAYNTGLNGQVLPGAPIISDDSGNQSVVGSTNAQTAIKNQSNAAQFNDVHGALDNLEASAKNLVAKGGSLSSTRIAAALAQPSGTLGQWLQGQGAKAGLTAEERQYVQSIAAAHENIQALRKSAGGTATDSAVAKLDAMIPGASTPDLNYLLGQTGQIRQTAERLGKGATVAAGGLGVRGQGNKKPPTGGGGNQTFTDGGVTYRVPANLIDDFKKDHPNAR